MVSTKPPAGTRDFLPDDLARRTHVLDTIRGAYQRHHFQPIETPVFERVEVLEGKYGDEGEQLMFKILKRGKKLSDALDREETLPRDLVDFGMRYDLTVPLSRVVAQYQAKLPNVFKCFQIRPVWRADRPAKGRFREFVQCDVDIVGTTSVLAEVDVLTAASEALAQLGFKDFTIRVNHRQLLSRLTRQAGIESNLSDSVLVSLDKLDKVGLDGVREELRSNTIEAEKIGTLFSLLSSVDPNQLSTTETRSALKAFSQALGCDAETASVQALDQIFALIGDVGLEAGRVSFDPTLARGLSYYTGPIFEIDLAGSKGSVGGGGRYDELIGLFLGRPVPACGISLGVERLLLIMEAQKMFPEAVSDCDVFVVNFPKVPPSAALRLAAQMRSQGLRVEMYPEAPKLKKQFGMAQKMGAKVVALIGPDELANNEVRLKNLSSSEQICCPEPEAVSQACCWVEA